MKSSRNKAAQAERRKGALQRLEAQLASGTKSISATELVDLTEEDKGRIKKEIDILKSRI